LIDSIIKAAVKNIMVGMTSLIWLLPW